MKDSLEPYAVVDLFAGPGGLGEGFAGCRQPRSGAPRFRTVLSVENDRHAHRTLLLRAFLRKFEGGFPEEYYRFVNGQSPEPNWAELDPGKWRQAVDETRCLELGTTQAHDFLKDRIEQIRRNWGDRTILIGGPPSPTPGGNPSLDVEMIGARASARRTHPRRGRQAFPVCARAQPRPHGFPR